MGVSVVKANYSAEVDSSFPVSEMGDGAVNSLGTVINKTSQTRKDVFWAHGGGAGGWVGLCERLTDRFEPTAAVCALGELCSRRVEVQVYDGAQDATVNVSCGPSDSRTWAEARGIENRCAETHAEIRDSFAEHITTTASGIARNEAIIRNAEQDIAAAQRSVQDLI